MTLPPPPSATRRRVARASALVVVVGLAAFWVYAFTMAPDNKVDALEDESFVSAANERCARTMAELDALPRAHEADTRAERAFVVDRSNQIVASLVAGLRADAANAVGRDRELLDRWFDDWDVYLDSRERYADSLRVNDDDAVFTVPARDGGQITTTMDGFARTNLMSDCLVPLDV